ncbi:MAG: hypothetical protein KJ634_10915 [Gammaproteobacteria bacterium]|nr:hypothetical protein [Gammaproteobacteria bacterium]MBU1416123.1 hypothetical protein [Gammaproteobacteria bacterium]
MYDIKRQKGFLDTAVTVMFSPIILAFLIGALPVLVPLMIGRGVSRMMSGAH